MIDFDPRRSYPETAVTDQDSACILFEAIEELVELRSPMYSGDAAAELHALVSLIAQANGRLAYVVADARDQDHTWAEIANQLGCSRLSAIARYAPNWKKRRRPLDPD